MSSTAKTYEQLLAEVKRLQAEGKVPTTPNKAQIIDFAYGNTKVENQKITRKIATRAVTALLQEQAAEQR